MSKEHVDLSIVWVHFYTPELLTQSISRMLASIEKTGLSSELIIVNNGGLPASFSLPTELQQNIRIISQPTHDASEHSSNNLGYAGGINLGIEQSTGRYLIVLNPDVLVNVDCVSALLEALQTSDITAPSLYLDEAMRFRLPANERRGFLTSLIRSMAERSSVAARIARAQWRTHTQRAFRSKHCYELNGAILAFTRATFNQLGSWDAGFQLYFEESDWLQRARRQGLRAAFAANATAVHLYAQSSRQNSASLDWYRASQQRFEQRYYAYWQRRLLNWTRHWAAKQRYADTRFEYAPPSSEHVAQCRYVEFSNTELGIPAASVDLTAHPEFTPQLAMELSHSLPNAEYFLRWIDHNGCEHAWQKIAADTP